MQPLDQPEDIGDRRPSLRRKLRAAKAPYFGSDDVELVRECTDLGLPHPHVCDPGVQQDQREPCARALVMDARAVDGGVHQINAVRSALNFSSVSSSSRAGSESGITPTPA